MDVWQYQHDQSYLNITLFKLESKKREKSHRFTSIEMLQFCHHSQTVVLNGEPVLVLVHQEAHTIHVHHHFTGDLS